MRHLTAVFLLSILSFFTQAAFAGPGHSHGSDSPVTSEEVTRLATTRLEVMVKIGVVEKSWENASVKSVAQSKEGRAVLWNIRFENERPPGPLKQRLELVFGLYGEYLAMRK